MLQRRFRSLFHFVLAVWGIGILGVSIAKSLNLISLPDSLERVWWFSFLLLGTALLGAVFQPLLKEYFIRTDNPSVQNNRELLLTDYETLAGYYPVAFITIIIGSFFLSPVFFNTQIFFTLNSPSIFWVAVLCTGMLNVLLFYFMNKAYRYGDLSLVSATWALSPVFAIPISFIAYQLLEDSAVLTAPGMSIGGIAGIAIILLSILGIGFIGRKQLPPAGALPNDWFTGYPVMSGILGSLIAAFAINFDKIAIEAGNPFLTVAVVAGTVALITGGITIARSGVARLIFIFTAYRKQFLILGALYGAILMIMALTLLGENVNYQGTIRRFSIVFAALYGIWILGEGGSFSNKTLRVLIALAAFSGVAIIAFFG